MQTERRHLRSPRAALRIGWMVVRVLVSQTAICGLAALLPVVAGHAVMSRMPAGPAPRLVALAALAVPAYIGFALMLMLVSGVAGRLLGWKTPPDAEMRLAEISGPLMRWVEYMAAIHVVRFFAGALLRGTPVWTVYLRLAGARLGRRVYVNSLGLSDYNLLEFGDDVVIGADAHVAGHTVERGVVRTGAVRLGCGVIVGIGSILDIGVQAGDRCQIAALTFVPKFASLDPDALYGGIPARRLMPQSPHGHERISQG